MPIIYRINIQVFGSMSEGIKIHSPDPKTIRVRRVQFFMHREPARLYAGRHDDNLINSIIKKPKQILTMIPTVLRSSISTRTIVDTMNLVIPF